MATKLSEKKILPGILLLIGAIVILLNIKIFRAPVQVSEKGILVTFLGILLFAASIKLLKRSFIKI